MPDPSKQKGNLWPVISIALLCSAVAGICGALVSRVYLWPDFSSPFSSEVNLSNLNANNSGLVIRDPKTVVVNQDVKITETINNIRPVLVGIFKELATTSPLAIGQKTDYYKLDEPLFVGLIITADGWVMALVPADLKEDFRAQDYVAISSDRKVYHIDKLADPKDQAGAPLIFHLADANNLPVKKIVPRADLVLGGSLLIVKDGQTIRPTTLTALTKTPRILSSDRLNARLSLADAGDDFNNSFVFDLAGNLAAVMADDEVIPAFSYSAAWSVLAAGGDSRPIYLGVNYLDLSTTKHQTINLDKGAWLYPTATSAAVIKGSPAEAAGLQAGDVITWVNNQEIGAASDLADLLATYKPGSVITLTYRREGVEKSAEIKLGELK
ncbi:MAG: PDZ domain-containing protein [Patescibacteria group bacterium]